MSPPPSCSPVKSSWKFETWSRCTGDIAKKALAKITERANQSRTCHIKALEEVRQRTTVNKIFQLSTSFHYLDPIELLYHSKIQIKSCSKRNTNGIGTTFFIKRHYISVLNFFQKKISLLAEVGKTSAKWQAKCGKQFHRFCRLEATTKHPTLLTCTSDPIAFVNRIERCLHFERWLYKPI